MRFVLSIFTAFYLVTLPVLAAESEQGNALDADLFSEDEVTEVPTTTDIIFANSIVEAAQRRFDEKRAEQTAAQEEFDEEAYDTATRRIELYIEAETLGDDVIELRKAAEAMVAEMQPAADAYAAATVATDEARAELMTARAELRDLTVAEAVYRQQVSGALNFLNAQNKELTATVNSLTALAKTLCGRLREDLYTEDCAAILAK